MSKRLIITGLFSIGVVAFGAFLLPALMTVRSASSMSRPFAVETRDLSSPTFELAEVAADQPSSRSAKAVREGIAREESPAPAASPVSIQSVSPTVSAPASIVRETASTPAESPLESAAVKLGPSGNVLVRIFYATDRERVEMGGMEGGRLIEIGVACIVGLFLTGQFVLLGFLMRPRRLLHLIAGACGVGTAVFAAVALRTMWVDGSAVAIGYGRDRGRLEMGTCEVSIPKNHQLGEVEAPTLWRFELSEDAGRHIVLQRISPVEIDQFREELGTCIQGSADNSAFVFVHGYNVRFADAAKRTAQIAHDLQFDGAPILYSWPSQGRLFSYAADETNVRWTVDHLRDFLDQVVSRVGAKKVHLIAHSMGNRALTEALHAMSSSLRQPGSPSFHEVVLTAPDIDADTFRTEIAPAVVKIARRVTLYASSNDHALAASRRFHGYPRAGDAGENVVIVPGVETIDVSGMDTSFLGHSYYASSPTVLKDLYELLRRGRPASERPWLNRKEREGLAYWSIAAADAAARPIRSSVNR